MFQIEAYGMEDNTKLQYQESGYLLLVCLSLCRFEFLKDNRVFDFVQVVAKGSMRFATSACDVSTTILLGLNLSMSCSFEVFILKYYRRKVACIWVSVADGSATGGDDIFHTLIVLLAVFGLDISLRQKVHQKDNHDRDEHNGRWP